MKIVLATYNLDKYSEMMEILSDYKGELLNLNKFSEIGEIIENGATLEENALIKARTVHKFTNLPAIADDTGLEVKALGGDPGIYSARYAGENASYSDNIKKLLCDTKNPPFWFYGNSKVIKHPHEYNENIVITKVFNSLYH